LLDPEPELDVKPEEEPGIWYIPKI